MALVPAAADEPSAATKKSDERPAATDDAKPSTGSSGPRQSPTLAPAKPASPAENQESKETKEAKSPSTPASPSAVPDRLPEKAEDAAAKSPGAGGKSVLQILPDDAPAETSAPKKPEAGAASAGAAADDKPLRPIPEEAASGKPEIETASFNGITPGVSTLDDLKKNWGPPKEMKKHNGVNMYLYSVDPFERVEVVIYENKITSIIIRLDRDFPAEGVAKQLALAKLQPVLVSNDMGEILGQSYPERGVLFSFTTGSEPGKPTMKVSQIIVEPVTAEPFLLRAETNLDTQWESSLQDLDQAVKLAPKNGRAHWLRCRALVLSGDANKASAAIDEAVRLEPDNPQYRLAKARVLGQLGRFAEAMEQAEKAVAGSDQRPHVKARAQCLLGDLASSGAQPDYKRAMQYHTQAIKTAEASAADPHPAIRVPCKEVLVDAHLGAAQDIAWGTWNNKEAAIAVWLKRATEFAEDLIKNDGGSSELRFRVATRALAACVGMQGKLDPGPWSDQVQRVGQELIAAAATASRKQQVQREIGLALYDAVQVDQLRNDRDSALARGQKAIESLEALGPPKDRPADAYLLGRLYFRMGAIRAGAEKNHRAALEWFDKAVAVLQQAAPQVAPAERGRLGETLVSMGVSYWEADQREKAVQVSHQGVEWMEKAVQDGSLPQTALDVPYNNLATMHRQLGQNDEARRFSEKIRPKPETIRR
jgi:tetratricopeptide (TPR) repeat protein